MQAANTVTQMILYRTSLSRMNHVLVGRRAETASVLAVFGGYVLLTGGWLAQGMAWGELLNVHILIGKIKRTVQYAANAVLSAQILPTAVPM